MEAALSRAALAPGAETQNAAAEAAPAPQTEAGERVLSGKQAGTAYVRNLLARMVTEEFLTAEEAAVVDAEKIAAFANSPLGRRIAASQQRAPRAAVQYHARGERQHGGGAGHHRLLL